MSELSRLRMELKADMEILAIRQGDQGKVVGDISHRLDRQAARILAQGEEIARHGEEIARHGEEIARHGEEIARQGQQIARQAVRIAEQSVKINEQSRAIEQSLRQTARLGDTVVEESRWTAGRLRLMGERFDAILGAVEQEYGTDHAWLERLQSHHDALQERVSRLEERDQPPAA